MSVTEKVDALCNTITKLSIDCGVKPYVKYYRDAPTKEEYLQSLDYLSEQAFDDQCTGANPRYPLFNELKALFEEVYEEKQ